jgi:predicted NAD/FAD-binding protein
MSTEAPNSPAPVNSSKTRRIAVIGAGITGMGAAHRLAPQHHVTLFESAARLGGHARTRMAGKNGDQPVDTGFIVFNYANYPHLAALFAELDVPVMKSNMSFGASFGDGRLEYALTSVGAIFSQKRNIVNPKFLGMLRRTRASASGIFLPSSARATTSAIIICCLSRGRSGRRLRKKSWISLPMR